MRLRMAVLTFLAFLLCQIFEKMLETGKPIVVAVNKVSLSLVFKTALPAIGTG